MTLSHTLIRLLPIIAIVSLQLAPASAQPRLTFKSIELAWPHVTLKASVQCDTAIRKDVTASNFIITENGLPITQFTVTCPTDPPCCTSTAIVIDRSGSMSSGSPSGIEAAKSGAKAFIDGMDGNCDEATLISFSQVVTVDVFMTNDKVLLTAGVDGLVANGATAVWDAGVTGVQELTNNGTQPCRAVILLTDGEDSGSSNTPADVISLALAYDVRVFTIGLGTMINDADLQSIAMQTGGQYYKVLTGQFASIGNVFRDIQKRMKQKFNECLIQYTSSCADGSMRQLDLRLQNLSGCPGTDTKSNTFVAPRDTSTFTPIAISLGSVASDFNQVVQVPLLLSTPVTGVFNTATFRIAVDTFRAQLRNITTTGYLLDKVNAVLRAVPGGYEITTNNRASISGSGVLAMLTFTTSGPVPLWTECVLDLASWNFVAGCLKPSLNDGAIRVTPDLKLLSPQANDAFCQGDSIEFRWSSKYLQVVYLDISSDAGTTFTPLLTVPSKNMKWQIPASFPPGEYMLRIRDGSYLFMDTLHPLSIGMPPTITLQPTDRFACIGSDVQFESRSTAYPDAYILWQRSTDNGATWGAVPGVPLNERLTLKNIQPSDNGALFRAVHSNRCHSGLPSNPARLTTITMPRVRVAPRDTLACGGRNAFFSVVPDVATGVTVAWQSSSNGGATFTDIPGATQFNYTLQNVSLSHDGQKFRAIITNACGHDISAAATLRVINPTVITSQPKTRIACEGDSVKLSVSASPAVGYQWFKDGVALPGRTNPLLDLGRVSMADAGKYFARIIGNCGPLDSDTAVVSVNTTTKISGHPTSQTVKEKTSVTFSVVAAGTNLRYQWMKNGVPIPNATGPSLTISSVVKADEGEYTVFIQGDCGDITSNAAQLGVTIVSIGKEPTVPRVATLHQNVPNPFASTSEIGFTIHEKTHVTITVHDLLGRTVETLVDQSFAPGNYTTRVDASRYRPGMHIYTLRAARTVEQKRLMILR